MPNAHRRRRRDSNVELSPVGGVYGIRNKGVGAQSTLGKKTFLPENMYEKLTKFQNFT